MFFIEILSSEPRYFFFFHSPKKILHLSLSDLSFWSFPSPSLLLLYLWNPNQISATYCPDSFPEFLQCLVLKHHHFSDTLLQLSPHPLWFCFNSIIYFLRYSIFFLGPFILKLHYRLSLQTVQRIKKSVLLSHALSSNAPWHLIDQSNYSKTRVWLCSPITIIIIMVLNSDFKVTTQ